MMQSTEGISDSDGIKPKIPEDYREDEAKEDPEKVRVLSVDKVTVEKIVLESSNGSREVLLTKNESSRKLSVRSETGKRILRRCKDERKESIGNSRFRASLPEDLFTSRNTNILNGSKSKLPIAKTRKIVASSCNEKRIRPIKLTKSPSIGSLVVGGLRSAHLIGKREKVPPKVPEKPKKKRQQTDVISFRADSARKAEGKSQEKDLSDRCEETEVKEDESNAGCVDAPREKREDKSVDDIDEKGIEEENPEETTVVDKDAQDRLEKSQTNIEILQKNLSTKIHASTAQSYKEKLGVRASYSLKFDPIAVDAKPSERIGASAFDQDFLERHNLDRKLKIEEKRLLETDFDYVSDAERTGDEAGEPRKIPRKPSYSEKVSEVEKRWSGEFLENRHERNSSESSKSSYVEEFGSVSSRESIVEDRGTSLLLERKNRRKLEERQRQNSVEEGGKRRTSEEPKTLEDSSTVSTVDSDSCLEDRIKAVEEDIEVASERRETLKDDRRGDLENKTEKDFSRSNEFFNLNERTSERISIEDDNSENEPSNLKKSDREEEEEENKRLRVEQSINVSEGSLFGSEEISLDSIDSTSFAIQDRPRKDGYASLIKEFTMEAGSSRIKKEEKQKKKLGLRRLLPGIFSPKDSRKDYKKKEQKEQKERKRHDEKHFARYQQNGNYTRSPDTMNLNEDIKRNVKLDNSLNGSVIEERLDEIKRELFPDEGPITSTPDHFSESEKDQRSLRDRARAPRSYGTDSSLSSIAPDDRWTAAGDRNLQLGISPDVRKYEVQRQKRDECPTRYGQLERKHSLQEHHGNRSCFLQRNHGPSGRISAPPAERRYVVRPRAIHPVDRPLPAIPRSRVELSTNYENYREEPGNTLRHEYIPDNSEYLSQPGFYENGESPDASSTLILTPVSAQVKITRQPIINQTQRAPLVGRTPKYPSPGSSQRSADYADSSCTPNSSQKSEFSPSSSKSGEYYLHSPRTSARTSPNERAFEDTREGIYENENENENGTSHSSRASENRYVEEERVYDETPPSPCVEEDEDENEGKSSSQSSPSRSEKYKKTESALTESVTSVEKQTIKINGGTFSTSQQDSTEKLISPTSPSSGKSRISISSRRSQPTDQILIASPKREALYEPRASRAPNQPRFRSPESPVPIADATGVVAEVRKEFYEGQDVSRKLPYRNVSSPGQPFSKDIPRPEPIYGHRRQRSPCQASSPSREAKKEEIVEEKVAWIQGQSVTSSQRQSRSPVRSELTNLNSNSYIRREEELRSRSVSRVPLNMERTTVSSSQEKIYSSRSPQREYPVYDRHQRQQSQLPQLQQQQLPRRSVYIQRIPEQRQQYVSSSLATCGPLSPSKRETRQHLEAFYWQQKALEAQKKSDAAKQTGWKIDLPEMREAVYWQQLKRLDEEQQRKIYEQKPMEERERERDRGSYERTSSCYEGGKSPMTDPAVVDVDRSYWNNKLQRPKVNPAGKPPLMQGQKGINQPVLIVRPQQAIRDRHEIPQKSSDIQELRRETQRSKSASPHFHRGDDRSTGNIPRKTEVCVGSPTKRSENHVVIEQENSVEVEGKPPPPPIFKRGSLLSSDSVEYGGTGPKRVSFSNQPNTGVGPEISASGSWPTKHGTAPEPPTRRHRSEDSTSDDSVFFQRDHPGQDSVYSSNLRREESVCGVIESEYDANRPLPPPPPPLSKDSPAPWSSRRGNCLRSSNFWNVADMDSRQGAGSPGNPKKWHAGSGPCESESGSEAASEVQRIFRRKQEEEWNSDGKGRHSNDTGGSGRGEGETGSNELTPGRRGGGGVGGGGVGVGSVGGSGVLGVGGGGVSGGGGGGSVGGGSGGRVTSGGGGRSRDEPRRHTLGGDHQPSLHHQQFNTAQQLHPLHPHHLPPPHGQYGTPPSRHTTMDLEMGTKSRQRKSPLPRGYPPPSSTMLFDDDPGIMSEVETSSTGFRRGGKQRSSLPVVRTPSKTLERPLGLVFLQYRNETKRALLPNEITSIDTVKALFVRSFSKQLSMEYLDSPHVKIYIHDSNKDMFYELEDARSHLRDIRDRSVLRLFESTDGVTGMPGPLGVPGSGTGLPPHWEDQSYFSEPEFDSEYQHQHIHKSKTAKNSTSGSGGYYVGGSSTLPRGGPLLRAYSPAASSVVAGPNATAAQPKTLTTPGGGGVPPAKPLRNYQCVKSPLGSLGGSARFSRDSSVSLYSIPDRLHGESGYMSSPERGGGVGSATRYPPGPYSTGSSYEDPYYSQYSGTVTPVIDEEASDTELLEESYSLYGVKPPGRPPSGPPRSPFPPGAPPPLPPGGQSYDATRIRVEHMERQLANLTGLVQKALTHAPHTGSSPRDYLQVPPGRDPYARTAGAGDEFDKHSSSSSASLPDDSYLRTDVKPPKLGKDKSVSFEKSVSFSDEPPDMNSPKQHSPQHAADTKPTKPAIKSSTLPRMSSQERDRHKPTPPPKPAALVAGQYVYRDLALTPEMYNQLRGLQKKAKDLRQEVRNLRRMSQAQAHTVRETIRDTFITIRAMLLTGGDAAWSAGDAEKIRLSREEDLYKQEMIRLEKDLTELESTVEELRGNVINRKTRVNMSDVENMALILSKSSKTVADLKVRFPSLQEGMKGLLSSEMEKVVREEKFLKEEPERLESALRRCKKLTGTLVTLKRLASVQEQRLPNAASVDAEETPPITPTTAQHSKATTPVPAERTIVGSASVLGGGSLSHEPPSAHQQRPENALDALLDELQTFSRPSSQLGQVSNLGGAPTAPNISARAPNISDIGRKGSVDSSSGILTALVGLLGTPGSGGTLRRLHSYPSSSDTDTSPPIARLQVSLQEQPGMPVVLPQGFLPPQAGQKPPVPERNAELLQLASARRVPPPPPPRTSSRSPLASPTSPQLPPRNHPCALQQGNNQGATATLRRPAARNTLVLGKEPGKPPMALPPDATIVAEPTPGSVTSSSSSMVLSTSNSSSCESVNSQEGLQSKRGRQEQLEQRHQELLRKQKALQEQYARLQQLQRNAAGLTTVPPAPPDLLKKTGSESNLLAKMGLGLSTASSGSLTSLSVKPMSIGSQEVCNDQETVSYRSESGIAMTTMPTPTPTPTPPPTTTTTMTIATTTAIVNATTSTTTTTTTISRVDAIDGQIANAVVATTGNCTVATSASMVTGVANNTTTSTTTTTTSKIYETDIL